MKQLKKLGLLLVLFSLAIILMPQQSFAKTEKPLNLYMNGQKVETSLKPCIINGSTLLPLRFTCELFNLPVDWDAKTKAISMDNGDEKITLKINQKNAEMTYVNGTTEKSLEQAPVLIANTTYVPIRFMADELNCTVQYDHTIRSVFIQKPFVFKNNQWYFASGTEASSNPTLIPVKEVAYSKYVKKGNTIYFVLHTGDNTMGCDYLYLLDDKGHAKKLFSSNDIREFHIDGDDCYIINDYYTFSTISTLKKISLSNPFQQTVLGDENFTYALKITLKNDNNKFFLMQEQDKWQFQSDGIYIVAYSTKALLENTVQNLDLLKKSYGYYLVDKDGNGQKLVENLPLEEYVEKPAE